MNLGKDSVGFVNRTVVLIQRSAGMADASDDIYGSYQNRAENQMPISLRGTAH